MQAVQTIKPPKGILETYTTNSTRGHINMVIRHQKYLSSFTGFENRNVLSEINKAKVIKFLRYYKAKLIRKFIVADNYGVAGNYNKRIYEQITPHYARSIQNCSLRLFTFFRQFEIRAAFKNLYRMKQAELSTNTLPTSQVLTNPNLEILTLNLDEFNQKYLHQHKKACTRILSLILRKKKIRKVNLLMKSYTNNDALIDNFLEKLFKLIEDQAIELGIINNFNNTDQQIQFYQKFKIYPRDFNLQNIISIKENQKIINLVSPSKIRELVLTENFNFDFKGTICTQEHIKHFVNLTKLSIHHIVQQKSSTFFWKDYFAQIYFPQNLVELDWKIKNGQESNQSLINSLIEVQNQESCYLNRQNNSLKKFAIEINIESGQQLTSDHCITFFRNFANISHFTFQLNCNSYFQGDFNLGPIFRTLDNFNNLEVLEISTPNPSLNDSQQELQISPKKLSAFSLINTSGSHVSKIDIKDLTNLMVSYLSRNLIRLILNLNIKTRITDLSNLLKQVSEQSENLNILEFHFSVDRKEESITFDNELNSILSSFTKLENLSANINQLSSKQIKQSLKFLRNNRKLQNVAFELKDDNVLQIYQGK